MTERADAAFYCVADRRYFPGAVAMVNSLRVVGHVEPIFLLDCGLSAEQRERLTPHVNIVDAPAEKPPWLLKTVAPLDHPAAITVLIDTDMIVTRPLTGLIEQASRGQVVAIRDPQQRFFAEWGELTGLGPASRRAYVSSGLVFLGGPTGGEILRMMDELQPRVDFELTFWRRNVRDYPFLYADQDVLNAILATSVEPDRITALERRFAATPPYRGLRILDEATLRCAYRDGTEPYVVHQYVRKPWLERTHHGVYSRLLRRLLIDPDAAVRPPPDDVPRHMRPGPAAWLERGAVNAKDFLRWRLGDRLPRPIARRVEALRRRVTGRL